MRLRSQVLGLYRGESPGTRVHTAIRWRSCPFGAVAEALPRRGRILEIGCGHGLFSSSVALGRPGCEVVGIDVDGDKIGAAQRAAARAGDTVALSFSAAVPGELPPGPWDAIVIIDVLYLIEPRDAELLVRNAAEHLAPGGTLLVKEMAPAPRWKFRLTTLQERVSVRVLGITEGATLAFVVPEEIGGWIGAAGLSVEHRRLDRRHLHPHHLVIGRKGGEVSSRRDPGPG